MKDHINELESMAKRDQQAILDFKSGKISAPELEAVNAGNVARLADITKVYGCPSLEDSELAYKAMILIALHSGDSRLIASIIEHFGNAPAGTIIKSDLGFLIDRKRVSENLPQLYGTQFKRLGGKIEFMPIEDIVGLDARRASIGMEPLEDYKKKVQNYK